MQIFFLAKSYDDMVSEFDAYLAPHWHGDLVGQTLALEERRIEHSAQQP